MSRVKSFSMFRRIIVTGAQRTAACGFPLLLLGMAGCGVMAHGQNAEGVRLFQQANYPAAMQKFQQALYSNPNNADAYYNLAATHHRLGKLQNTKTELDQAEGLYHQCLDHDPNHSDCHRGLAVLLVEEDRSGDAFKLLEGWATRNPTIAEPKVQLARLYEEFSDNTAAKQQLVEALTIEPTNPRALAALGKLHEMTGNPTQALAVYERSLWHNSLQPEVASRISALRTIYPTQPAAAPPASTHVVGLDGPLVR